MSEAKRQQVLVDITIAAPVETVWQAIRDPEQIRKWFGWDADTLKEEIDFIFLQHASEEPGHALQFGEWEGSSTRFELVADGAKTRFRIVQSGNAPGNWDDVYEDVTQGWVTFAQQMRLALEQHAGAERRTIFLSGAAKAGVGEPSAALGLSTKGSVGSGYEAQLATGEMASGQIWHRTNFQTGYTVGHWGDGLLVVTDKGISDTRPHGGGSVILTTYGLSEADFAALKARWEGWWAERYPAA
jgi:hypothetical protein